MTDLPAGHRLLLLLMMLLGSARPAAAQQDNPVYVDDSPRAWELFRQARDQAADNEAEAVRLYQELLDDYGGKLIPVHDDAPDHFVSVRDRVLEDLRANESLLGRYRLMQTRQAQRLLDGGELSRLAMTRPLTGPGLDATLRLAQEALESARFHAAVTRLEAAIDHPDLTGRSAAQCWFMLALARHYLHRDEPVAPAVARLKALGAEGQTCLEELTRLIAAGAGPSVDRAATPLDQTGTRDLDELVAQTIWSVELEDSLLSRRFRDSGGERPSRGEGYDRLRNQGTFNTMAAAVSDALVFVNEGHTIRALDRYSGRSAWPRPFTDLPRLTISDLDNTAVGDLNLIAVEGETLVTLTGHAHAGQRSSGGGVICLEASTGQLRWATDLDRLGAGDEYEGLFSHGRPVILEGAVYVLARKLSRQLLTGSYVVALDLESGGLRWIRHLASSGSQNRAAKPFSTLVEDDGDLFAASPVGAVARLDAATGMIRWLVRFPAPMNLRSRPRLPWELSAPVVVGRRVFAITPDERRIVALDRATGTVTDSFDARSRETWNAPAYLLASDRFIYAVGSEIRAFLLDAPDQPAWRLPASQRRGDDGVSHLDDLTLAGRAQLVNGALIVPAQRGVLIVDGETGRIIHHLAVDGHGNPVAIDAQLILASADSVDAYMSLGRAEQMLRRRIAEEPDDPSASLSLLQLGMRVGKLDLALQAADLTLRAIEAGSDDRTAGEARRELFSLLLEIHRRRLASTTEQGEALYERFDAVARTAAQRVEHLLAYGDWLASSAPVQAMEAYQAILSDPVLAAGTRGEAGVLRPASLWAAARLGALIAEHGPALYAAQAEEARRGLIEILSAEPTDADALFALALEFPFTDTSLEAAARAAQLQRRRGDHRRALAVLSDAYHIAPRPRRAERLLGPFLETCLAQGHTRQARLILQTIINTLGDLQLDTAQGPRRVGRWLAELAAGDAVIRLPRVGDHGGPAEVLDGRLLPVHAAAVAAPPPDRALLLHDQELRLISAEALQELWTTTLDHGSAELIDCDEEELLLWVGPKTDNPRLEALDAGTGRLRWVTPLLSDHINEPLARDRPVAGRMPDGMPFDSRETLPVIGPEAMFLVQRSGGVAAFDRADGRSLLWAQDRTLEEVHLAIAHEFGLVLAGRDREFGAAAEPDGLQPRIVVLDPMTGALLHRLRPQGRSGVIWMAADPLGSLLCATAGGIEQIDLLAGRRRWTTIAFDTMDTRRATLAAGFAIMESATTSLLALRLEDGLIFGPFQTAGRGDWDPLSLEEVHLDGNSVIARYRQRVIRYDAEGNVLGADVILGNRDYRKLLLADGRLIVISQHDSRQVQMDAGAVRQTQRTYRIYILSENGKLEGEMIQPPPFTRRLRDAAVIDGWLLLSTDGQTLALALPLPADGGQ